MSLPVTVPLVVYRGDSWSQIFRLRKGDIPLDLTAATVEAQARSRKNGGTVHDLVVDVTDPVNGELTLRIGDPAPAAGQYDYDVEVTDGGEVTTWVRGSLTLARDVTNEQP